MSEEPPVVTDTPEHGTAGAPRRTPTSRSQIGTTTAMLTNTQTVINVNDNTAPLRNPVPLNAERLHQVFIRILRPIAASIHRYCGARTVTDPGDVHILDSCAYTVACDALYVAHTVMYNKATKITPTNNALFGDLPIADNTQFPSVLTLLVNSLGPCEQTSNPYRCTFIPYITRAECNNIRNQTGNGQFSYNLGAAFRAAMQRASKSVSLTDVDVMNDVSSSWWMLYPVLTNEATSKVYNPVHYNENDQPIVLGSILLNEPLYNAPGPLISAVIGPFIAGANATPADIPANLRGDLYMNSHIPARYIYLEVVHQATRAEAAAFGILQNNNAIQGCAGNFQTAPIHWIGQHITNPIADWQTQIGVLIDNLMHIIRHRNEIDKTVKKGTDKEGAQVDVTNLVDVHRLLIDQSDNKVDPIPDLNLPANPPGPNSHCDNNLSLYRAIVLYFDHVIIERFELARRDEIIMNAIRPN